MRILDKSSNKPLKDIILYLTESEAIELRDSLDIVLKKPINNHAHIPSEDFKKEITVCIYDNHNLRGFDERSISLISNDP